MAPPAPNHGFAIELAPDNARIWVEGSYNALFSPSAHAAVGQNLSWIRDEGDVIGEPQFRASRLGDLTAAELLVHYRDRKTSIVRTCKAIAALRASPKEVGIIYEITLDTPSSRFAEDERVWQQVVLSFQLLPQ